MELREKIKEHLFYRHAFYCPKCGEKIQKKVTQPTKAMSHNLNISKEILAYE
jgi:predicted RNA-binding Zn-ribbon protein involved in translation (DUF1610 family)